MSAEDESSWRLLFSIALSHGEALHSRQLTWEAWMVFLSSARLIGTTAGVFPVLLDQLWQRQALFTEGAPRRERRSEMFTSSSTLLDEASRHASDSTGSVAFVEFGGFVDMMKVLCLRVYQTFQFAHLRAQHGEDGDAVLLALRRCAEDRVLLTEAVRFTASRYLKPFITESTIHTTSRVGLRAARNGWAVHVNRLVTHIVGALAQTTIVPVYRKYANTAVGRMTEEDYCAFLKDYLPGLNTLEETCALAIFTHGGFPDIRPLLKPLLSLAATSADVSLLTSTPTLGLTDFIEALLMLAVVVSADEERHPSLRPITAKVWLFFERYLCCGGTGGSSMCADPYVTGRYAAMPPGLVAVFPNVVALLPCPTLFVEVCNAPCYVEEGDTSSSPPPTSVKQPALSPGSPNSDKTPFLTEVVAQADTTDSSPTKPTPLAAPKGNVAMEAASPFFAARWSLLECNADVPFFGEGEALTACQVTVGGTVVNATPTSCPEIWKISLSALSLESVKLNRCAVETTATTAGLDDGGSKSSGSEVKLIFTPLRSFPVELVIPEGDGTGGNARNGGKAEKSNRLQNSDGDAAEHLMPWGCKDVVLTDTSVTQLMTASLVSRVRALLDEANKASSTPVAAATADSAPSSLQQATVSLASFCEVCRRLRWCGAREKDGATDLEHLCSQALTSCRLYHRLLHASASRRNAAPLPPSDGSQRMSVLEVLGCLSVLLFRDDLCGLRDIPDVPRRLELALHSAISAETTPATTATPAADLQAGKKADIRSLPHNKLRDEPFMLALERKELQSAASRERRAALIKAIRDHHTQQMSGPVVLPPLPESRPNAMRLVSQYGNVDPTEDFQRVMLEGAETVKAYFIEKELAIPEWRGS
ncbi:hypothetical protein ABB37_03520 [Leptomonas pyrrhocoris]|uniref:Uncharacterized protein n=1 Tax=Leptomonas pyrrhocoris TaxID=157538 RepID=A0A0M9G549_LEPPY|nr:hypothetical protein ABB37_03520 [Leptomonas pyrrhocoris]KPA82457.1 hypothetical protein ABB37_03520 [Leptomonas pyrrhocoris]|eukprot:XP_015660896.1 hypothetical protein ABB37_03520 [Leptomonas pyrrhocoris]